MLIFFARDLKYTLKHTFNSYFNVLFDFPSSWKKKAALKTCKNRRQLCGQVITNRAMKIFSFLDHAVKLVDINKTGLLIRAGCGGNTAGTN